MKAVTIRIPESVDRELRREARRQGKTRGRLLREIIQLGVEKYVQDQLIQQYQKGDVSEEELCRRLGLDRWEFLEFLKRNALRRNVSYEDWLDSEKLFPSSK